MPDLTPDVPSALSPLVRRIVAPNPGPMTGPGTNTYLVGIDEVAVIDPGPDDAGAHRRDRRRVDARACPLGAAHPHASRPLAGAPSGWSKATGAEVLAFSNATPTRTPATSCPTGRSATATRSTAPSSGSRCCTRPATRRTTCASSSTRSACCSPATRSSTGMYSVVIPGRGGDMAEVPGDARAAAEAAAVADRPGHGDVIEEPKARHRRVPRAPQAARAAGARAREEGPGEDHRHRRRALRRHRLPAAARRGRQRQVHAHLLKLQGRGQGRRAAVRRSRLRCEASPSTGSQDWARGARSPCAARLAARSRMRAVQPLISIGGSSSSTMRVGERVERDAGRARRGGASATGRPVSPPADTAGSSGIRRHERRVDLCGQRVAATVAEERVRRAVGRRRTRSCSRPRRRPS